MSTVKFTMICNVIIEVFYTACVTVAAIVFAKPTILGWYILLLGIGYSTHSTPPVKKEGI